MKLERVFWYGSKSVCWKLLINTKNLLAEGQNSPNIDCQWPKWDTEDTIMALSSLTPSNMLGELGRLANWLKGDCVAPEEYAGLAVTEKVSNVRKVFQ